MRLLLTAFGLNLIDLTLMEREEPDEGSGAAGDHSVAPSPGLGFIDRTAPGSEPFYPTYE